MDPITAGAAITAGASVIGNLFGSSSNKATNATNLKIARENRAWEEKMSNTAYRRAVTDMEAAGLNPAQMLGGGGAAASTPTAPTAQMTAYQPDMSGMYAAGNIIADERLKNAQADNLDAATGKTETETKLNNIEIKFKPLLQEALIKSQNATTANTNAQTMKTNQETIQLAIENEYLTLYGHKPGTGLTETLTSLAHKIALDLPTKGISWAIQSIRNFLSKK